jgi:ABC-type uncharacterized transport system ATPase subunit
MESAIIKTTKKNTSDFTKIMAPVRYLKQTSGHALFVEGAADAVVDFLKNQYVNKVTVERPTLDEVFIAFVKGQVNHS